MIIINIVAKIDPGEIILHSLCIAGAKWKSIEIPKNNIVNIISHSPIKIKLLVLLIKISLFTK